MITETISKFFLKYVLQLLIGLILLLSVSCSGSKHTTSSQVTIPEKSEHVELIEVKMSPQQPVFDFSRSISIDKPNELLAKLTAISEIPYDRNASGTNANLTKKASAYESSLANQNIKVNSNTIKFTPNWDKSAPKFEGLSYNMYRFSLKDFGTNILNNQTIQFSWTQPLSDFSEMFVGFGDIKKDCWIWYQGPLDNVLTIPSYTPYTKDNGDVLICIVIAGKTSCELQNLTVGNPELRATGANISSSDNPLPEPENVPPIATETTTKSRSVSALASTYDLSSDFPAIGDQGWLGSCTAWAVGNAAFNYELNRLYKADGWNINSISNQASVKYLYFESGKDEGLSFGNGRWTDRVVAGLKDKYGDSTENNAPYDVGWGGGDISGKWSSEAIDDASLLKINGYQILPCRTDDDIKSLKAVLSIQKSPIIFSIAFNGTVYPNKVWEGGAEYANHAMCIVGYDDSKNSGKGAFKVRNSWGTDWGDSGYFWMSYDSLKRSYTCACCEILKVNYNPKVVQRFLSKDPTNIPPSNLVASNGTDTKLIKLTWNKIDTATGYEVYRDNQTNLIKTIDSNTNSYDDATVTDNYSHIYWLKARYGSQSSMFSTADTGYLQTSTTVPAPPTDVTASIDRTDGIKISWTKSVNATSYKVYRSTLHYWIATVDDADTYLDTKAYSNVNTTYYVKACNAFGFSDASEPVVGKRIIDTKDIYEPDNNTSDSQALSISTSLTIQTHTISQNNDQDWIKFDAIADTEYSFWSESGSNYDTNLSVFNSGGVEMTADDDSGSNKQFDLFWIAPNTGTYFLRVMGLPDTTGSYTINMKIGLKPKMGVGLSYVLEGGFEIDGSISMQLIDDPTLKIKVPAIAYNNMYKGLKFARAKVANPTAASDWVIMDVDAPYYMGLGCSLVILEGGVPGISYGVDKGEQTAHKYDLKFAYASKPDPSSTLDWTCSILQSQTNKGGLNNTNCITVFDDSIKAKVPFFTYIDGWSTVLTRFARATAAKPSSSDWVYGDVYNPSTNFAISRRPSLAAQPDGKPAVAIWDEYSDKTKSPNSRSIKFYYANTLLPTSSSDWTYCTAIEPYAYNALSHSLAFLNNGAPAIVFSDFNNVYFTYANKLPPTDYKDWTLMTINKSSSNASNPKLTIDTLGNPVVSHTGEVKKGLTIIRSSKPVPTLTDWTAEDQADTQTINQFNAIQVMPDNKIIVVFKQYIDTRDNNLWVYLKQAD